MHFAATSVGGVGLTAVGLLQPVEVAVHVFRGGGGVGGVLGLAWIFGCVGFGWLGKFVARGFELIEEALLVGRDFFLVGFGYNGSGKWVGLRTLLEVGDDGGEACDESVEGLCVGCGVCNVVRLQWFSEGGDVADEF